MKTLEDQPVLHRHLQWIWQAFTDLNYRRGVSFSGPVPITFSDIEAYCRLKGIYSLLEREYLLRLLDSLDRHWMANHYEKSAKEQKRDNPKPSSKPSRTPKGRAPRKQ